MRDAATVLLQLKATVLLFIGGRSLHSTELELSLLRAEVVTHLAGPVPEGGPLIDWIADIASQALGQVVRAERAADRERVKLLRQLLGTLLPELEDASRRALDHRGRQHQAGLTRNG